MGLDEVMEEIENVDLEEYAKEKVVEILAEKI